MTPPDDDTRSKEQQKPSGTEAADADGGFEGTKGRQSPGATGTSSPPPPDTANDEPETSRRGEWRAPGSGSAPASSQSSSHSWGNDPRGSSSDSRSDPPRGEGARAERGIPDAVRRLLEAGLERLGERPDQILQRLSELRLPREAWTAILAQLDDRKSGLYRLIAKEVRDLLQNTNFAEDLVRALTKLSFEIKTEVRFIPNDAGGARPNVRSKMRVNSAEDEPGEAERQKPPSDRP